VRTAELSELLRAIETIEARALLGGEPAAVLLEAGVHPPAHLRAELFRGERLEAGALLRGESLPPVCEGPMASAELLALRSAAIVEGAAVANEARRTLGIEAAESFREGRALLRCEAAERLVEAPDLLASLGRELAPALAVPCEALFGCVGRRGRRARSLLSQCRRGDGERGGARDEDRREEQEGAGGGARAHPELPRVSTGNSSMISRST